MKRSFLVLLFAGVGFAIAQTADKPTVKRRLTGKEEKAAVLYHTNNWLKYRIALYTRHLATPPEADMRRKVETMKKQAEEQIKDHVTWGRSWALANTNLVTVKDVDWNEIIKTNTTMIGP